MIESTDPTRTVYDSGFTRERRELYKQLGEPLGTRTVDFVRWIATSHVTRTGEIPVPRTWYYIETLDYINITTGLTAIASFEKPCSLHELRALLGVMGVRLEEYREGHSSE
jgi:hypothetical protein